MVLTNIYTSAPTLTRGGRGPFYREIHAGTILLLGVVLQSASAADKTTPPESAVTQAVREQLQQRTALQSAAAEVNRLRTEDAVAGQKEIDRLNAELEDAVQRLSMLQEAQRLAATGESEAVAAVAVLKSQLERHRSADALQAAADAALKQLNERREEIVQWDVRLSGLHKESFSADQAGREAQRQADVLAGHAEEKRQTLEAANQASVKAEVALDESRLVTVQTSRALSENQRLLDQASAEAGRARRAVERLAGTAAAIKNSAMVMQQAVEISAARTPEAVSILRTVVNQVSSLHTRAEQILDARMVRVQEVREQRIAAAASHATAESVRRMRADAHSARSRQHFAQQREVVKLMVDSQQQHKTAQEFNTKKEQLRTKIRETEEKKEEVEGVVERLQRDWVDLQSQVEQAQEPLGRFVSFSRDVAPILARRCMACHNTRTAGGKLNLNSFAGLLKGGDSGPALIPHDTDDSLLLTMVQDGSMPKNADPLASDEIDVVRRWIEVGAPLDAAASDSADLFDIMPELPQPLPPATYRVPIPVLTTAFSPDGVLLATSGYHEVLLWDSHRRLVRRIANVAQRVNDVEFTADGTILVIAAGTPGQLGEVKLFRVADGTHLATPVRTTDSVYTVSISPDGMRLAAGGADQKIRIVDMETQDVLQVIEDHADSVMDVSWSPSGDRIASASYDKTCRVFDAVTGEVRRTFTNHKEPVYAVAFQADGQSLVSGGADSKLRVWPVEDGEQIQEISGFADHIFRISVTSDGRVYSAGADREIREHQIADGKLVRSMTGHGDWVYALALGPQGERLATGCYDGEVRLWNSADGSMLGSFVAIPEQGDAAVTVTVQ